MVTYSYSVCLLQCTHLYNVANVVQKQLMYLYNVRLCIYNVCLWTMYVSVQCMSLYNVYLCTVYVSGQCMHLYNVCLCTMYGCTPRLEQYSIYTVQAKAVVILYYFIFRSHRFCNMWNLSIKFDVYYQEMGSVHFTT